MNSAKNDFVIGKKSTITNIQKLPSKNDLEMDTISSETYFPIKEFGIDELCKNPAMHIIGKREAGKSWLIRNIIHYQYQKKIIDEVIVFNPSEKTNKFYSHFVENVQLEMNFQMLKTILDQQSKTHCSKKIFIVFDDCINSINNTNRDIIEELACNSRHYNISFAILSQYPIALPPQIRCNFDYIFLFQDNVISNTKRIYDNYAGMFPTFKLFEQIFKKVTTDYCALIFIQRGMLKTLFDRTKWIKSQNVEFKEIIKCPIKKEFNFTLCPEHHTKTGDDISFSSVKELNKNDKDNDDWTLSPIKNKAENMSNIFNDVKNKNKYDVLYQILKCNEKIIENELSLNENKINSIIELNLKIAEFCLTSN